MADDGDFDLSGVCPEQEMVGETGQITTTPSAGIEVVSLWELACVFDSRRELYPKIVSSFRRDFLVLSEDFANLALNGVVIK